MEKVINNAVESSRQRSRSSLSSCDVPKMVDDIERLRYAALLYCVYDSTTERTFELVCVVFGLEDFLQPGHDAFEVKHVTTGLKH